MTAISPLNENELDSLAVQLGQCLQKHHYRLVTAESCTGGGLAAQITAIAGSSAWFDCGFVTYSNESKQKLLGVSPAVLETHGAVSQETVTAMLRGALSRSHAQIAIAITGIAGPTGGSADKPVGTVWLGWSWPNQEKTQCYQFTGDRNTIRWHSIKTALQITLEQLG